MIIVKTLKTRAALALRDEVVTVYAEAFAAPPYAKGAAAVASFAAILARHAARAGFRMVVARAGDCMAGFAYGYAGAPGQWWHDAVAAALAPEDAARWLCGAFELAELAVRPAYQGQGIGGRLHDTLLANLPRRTAVLSTIAEETAGLQLYRRRGWQVIHPGLSFPNTAAPYLIMARDLA